MADEALTHTYVRTVHTHTPSPPLTLPSYIRIYINGKSVREGGRKVEKWSRREVVVVRERAERQRIDE